METSKNWLQKYLGIERFAFCYPNGKINDVTATAKTICQSLGYELAFTTMKQAVSARTDKYAIPRFDLPLGSQQVAWLLGKSILSR